MTEHSTSPTHLLQQQRRLSDPTEWGVFAAAGGTTTMAHILTPAHRAPLQPSDIAYIVVVGKNARKQRPKFHLVVEDDEEEQGKASRISAEEGTTTEESSQNPSAGSGEHRDATPSIQSDKSHDANVSSSSSVPEQSPAVPEQIEFRPVHNDDDTVLLDTPVLLAEEAPKEEEQQRKTTETITQSATSILSQLAASEKRERKLQMQLAQSGIACVTTDIPYAVAKQKIAEIAERMNAVTEDTKDEYFQLEKEMEKYNAAIVLTDEYQEELEAAEQRWEDSIVADNQVALLQLRRHMPVDVRRKTVDEIKSDSHPDLPVDLLKRFKRTNVLTLLRVNPSDIEAFHPSMLESMRVTGLTLTERRALHAHLIQVGKNWREKGQTDTVTSRKYEWFSMMRSNFREAMQSYQNHSQRFQTSDSGDTNTCTCLMKGRGCPIRANALVDYTGDFGCPTADEYEVSSVTKRADVGTTATSANEAAAATEESSGVNNRKLALRKYYRGLLQVSRATAFCESVDEIMEECNSLAARYQADERSTRLGRDTTDFSSSLKRLTKSAEDRAADLKKLSVIEVDVLGELNLCLERAYPLVMAQKMQTGESAAWSFERACQDFDAVLETMTPE